MTHILWQVLKHSPSILGASLLVANAAFAAQTSAETTTPTEFSLTTETVAETATTWSQPEVVAQFSEVPSVAELSQPGVSEGMAQVTSVSQLSDVQPTDWAFQALQSLVERYGCIAGYPDGTYRGQRAMTRYEFAAGLNACLDRISELIGSATANVVTREDLAILQRLQEEFASELATLRGRVDGLEARVAELENNQFSTTTKLNGEAIFMLADTWGNRVVDEGHSSDDDSNTIMAYRVRLNFDTSFTGKDLLRTRLQARNISTFDDATGTRMTRLGTAGDSGGAFELDDLYYRFPLGKARVFIVANSLDYDGIGTVLTPFNSSGTGALSRFGRRNPLVFRGPENNAGIGFQLPLGSQFRFNAAYLAGNPGDPTEGNGIFNGSYGALGQLVWQPNRDFGFSVTYNHKYFSTGDVNVAGSTGSFNAQRPFGNVATTADNLAAEMNWKLGRGFQIGGWYGYTWADQKRGGNNDATIQNWAVTLGFPNLLGEGNLGGIIVGMPPKVTDHDDRAIEDDDSSLHIEAFYRWQVSDFISITPGFFVITNPEHDDNNDTLWMGAVRTTFSF